MRKLTVRVDEEFYKELKKLMIDLDSSLQDYFTNLAKKDIEERKKE